VPPAPAPEPIPPPLSPQPEVVDAGPPLPVVFDAGTPAPVPVPTPEPVPISPPAEPAPPPSTLTLRIGIEGCINSWPQGQPQDLLFCVRPLVSFDAGEDFAAELGATMNFLIFDDPPENRSQAIGGFLRKQDWDESSDFGQPF